MPATTALTRRSTRTAASGVLCPVGGVKGMSSVVERSVAVAATMQMPTVPEIVTRSVDRRRGWDGMGYFASLGCDSTVVGVEGGIVTFRCCYFDYDYHS